MQKIDQIKVKSHKRTIFIGGKSYFLELPDITFVINKVTISAFDKDKFYFYFYLKNQYLHFGNISANKTYLNKNFHSLYNVCLNIKNPIKECNSKELINRFFQTKFAIYFYTPNINSYFYSQWQKYGLKYYKIFENYHRNKLISMKIKEFKEIEKDLIKNFKNEKNST